MVCGRFYNALVLLPFRRGDGDKGGDTASTSLSMSLAPLTSAIATAITFRAAG